MTDTELRTLIDSLRAETEAKGISPEDVGYICDALLSSIAAAKSETNNLKNGMSNASTAISNLQTKENELNEALTSLATSVSAMSDAYDELDTSVNEHVTEVAIYAFNGTGMPSTSSAVTGMSDGVWYSSTEGLFYRTTSGVPSLTIPHNANGKARADCLYRMGNVLYRFDGTSLSEYVSPAVAVELAELRSLIANLG